MAYERMRAMTMHPLALFHTCSFPQAPCGNTSNKKRLCREFLQRWNIVGHTPFLDKYWIGNIFVWVRVARVKSSIWNIRGDITVFSRPYLRDPWETTRARGLRVCTLLLFSTGDAPYGNTSEKKELCRELLQRWTRVGQDWLLVFCRDEI